MDNVSALSVSIAAPHGRAGPGTWGREKTEGFTDFISALMSRSENPAAARTTVTRSDMSISAEQPIIIWTAPPESTVYVKEAAQPTDMDVELVVSPQLADSQEDLLLLMALLLGEEENDGFLFALKQYILETPKLITLLANIPPGEDEESKVLILLDYLLLLAQEFSAKDDLPPELAPLEIFAAMFAPPDPHPAEPDAPAILAEPEQIRSERTEDQPPPVQQARTEQPEEIRTEEVKTKQVKPEAVKTEKTDTEPMQPEKAEAGPAKTETVKTEPAATKDPASTQNTAETRELPNTVRVTEIRIAPPRRAAYTNPFSAILRPVHPAAAPTTALPDAIEQPEQFQEEMPVTAAEAEEPTVWDLTEEENGTPAVFGKQAEVSSKETIAKNDSKPVEAAAPQTGSAQPAQIGQTIQAVQAEQTEAPAPARQILAEKIIDQISAQMAQSRDVSTIQMELNPKFLGKIQLVIEATAEGITAKLRSENGAVRSLLNEHIADLRNSLKEAGVNMKDIEVTESRIGTELSDRRSPQENFETAGEKKSKVGGISSLKASNTPEHTEPHRAAYATGRVAGTESQFDYMA
jgi:flagellar hook-length control protein FliK